MSVRDEGYGIVNWSAHFKQFKFILPCFCTKYSERVHESVEYHRLPDIDDFLSIESLRENSKI